MEDNIGNWLEIITDGRGNGFGNVYGSGRGNGFGNVYGSGRGEGNGNGYGDGDGDGGGHGIGIFEFNGYRVYDIDWIPTIIYSLSEKANVASGAIIDRNSRLVPCFIANRGGCFAHGEGIHEAVRDAESKYMRRKPLNERIEDFMNVFSISGRIPAKELFKWHNILTGSCEMGRKQFCEEHNINVETDSFTIPEFISLTKDSYGGEVIKELEEKVAANV